MRSCLRLSLWLVLFSVVLVGVRMARIGFIYADIYLYTVAVGVDCGAFSRSCGGVVRLWLVVCVYGYMQGLFRVGVV